MKLTLDKSSALRLLRFLRGSRTLDLDSRCELPPADPSPRTRWTAGMLPLRDLALLEAPSRQNPLHVVVPSVRSRVKASFAECAVISGDLPARSFLDVGGGVFIPCPELLFARMADVLPFHSLCLLGYELCGGYSRDHLDPRSGEPTYGLSPLTTPEELRGYLLSCRYLRGSVAALKAAEFVFGNAWSPAEALVALLLALPTEMLGYNVGRVVLNDRKSNGPTLVSRGCRGTRVPDILIPGCNVGINYDGRGHLDLGGVVGESETAGREAAARRVRRKYVDDLRRNRELAAMGFTVLPVTSEDLAESGGLDTVVLEMLEGMAGLGGARVESVRRAIADPRLAAARQRLIWSCMPRSAERGTWPN